MDGTPMDWSLPWANGEPSASIENRMELLTDSGMLNDIPEDALADHYRKFLQDNHQTFSNLIYYINQINKHVQILNLKMMNL